MEEYKAPGEPALEVSWCMAFTASHWPKPVLGVCMYVCVYSFHGSQLCVLPCGFTCVKQIALFLRSFGVPL